MSLDKTLENQRAVRILAYNRMEITAENIERVKEADKQVTAVIEKLTPKNVLQMIRDGVNPLEKTFGELESYFAENPQSYEEEAEDYSRFLYQLEQKKDITENERKAYIGIYRMVHQIEREDGAAVGAVVNIGAELQFSTLLAASRSRRTSHMDWKVSDDTGLTQEVRLSAKAYEQADSNPKTSNNISIFLQSLYNTPIMTMIYVKSKHILDNKLYQKGAAPGTAELLLLTVHRSDYVSY